jgi:hypothetical protein
MNTYAGTRAVDAVKFVRGLSAVVPNSAAPRTVNLQNSNHATILIGVKNATTVTGSTITLKQSQDVSGTGAKALSFLKVYSNIDCGAGDTLSETVVASTFTTDATNSKELMYVIEVDATTLDVNNGFSCIQVQVGNATAATVWVDYLLGGQRFSSNYSILPSAIV